MLVAAVLNFFLVATKLTAGLPQTGFRGASFCFESYQQLSAEQALDVFGRFKKDAKKEIARFVFYKPHRFLR